MLDNLAYLLIGTALLIVVVVIILKKTTPTKGNDPGSPKKSDNTKMNSAKKE